MCNSFEYSKECFKAETRRIQQEDRDFVTYQCGGGGEELKFLLNKDQSKNVPENQFSDPERGVITQHVISQHSHEVVTSQLKGTQSWISQKYFASSSTSGENLHTISLNFSPVCVFSLSSSIIVGCILRLIWKMSLSTAGVVTYFLFIFRKMMTAKSPLS